MPNCQKIQSVMESKKEAIELLNTFREMRKQNKISIVSLCEMLSEHRTTIYRIENGEVDPRLSTIIRYLHGIGCHLECISDNPLDNTDTSNTSESATLTTPSTTDNNEPESLLTSFLDMLDRCGYELRIVRKDGKNNYQKLSENLIKAIGNEDQYAITQILNNMQTSLNLDNMIEDKNYNAFLIQRPENDKSTR